MNKITEFKTKSGTAAGITLLGIGGSGLAQEPQENWYLEQTWMKTGTLVHQWWSFVTLRRRHRTGWPNLYGRPGLWAHTGLFSRRHFIFSITNGFGAGSQPRGMITDSSGNLYVADRGSNAVLVFTANGNYLQKIGGTNGRQMVNCLCQLMLPLGLITRCSCWKTGTPAFPFLEQTEYSSESGVVSDTYPGSYPIH